MADESLVPVSKRLVLINSASAIATRVLTVGVFAWVIQYLMKRIPEVELALLPIVTSVAMLLPLLQTILTAGLSRHITEAYARRDFAGVTAIVSSQVPLLSVAAIFVALVGIAITIYIDELLRIPPHYLWEMRLMLLLVTARLAIGMSLVPFNTGLFAQQRFVTQNLVEIASSLLRIGLMLFLILGFGPKVQWVIVAMVSSQLFALVTTTVLSMRAIPALRFRPASFRWGVCRANLSFGWWYFLLEVANYIRRATDAPILNLFASAIAVNDFFLGATVELQLREMTIRAVQPLLPALTSMHAHGQHDRLKAAFLRVGRLTLWAALFLPVPLIVFSYDLFALYLGEKYDEHMDAPVVMILLLLGIACTNTTSVFMQIAHAKREIRPLAIQIFVAQLGNLALTLALVGWLKMGAIGSAMATLLTFAIANPLFHWPLAIRTLHISWSRFLTQTILPGILPALVGGAVGWIYVELGPAEVFTRVLIGIPLCIMAYIITLCFALRPADWADLIRIRHFIRANV